MLSLSPERDKPSVEGLEEKEGEEEGGKGSLSLPLPLEPWRWWYPLDEKAHEEDAAGEAEEDEEGEVGESAKSRAGQLAAACWYLENSALAKYSELIIWRR